MNPRPDGPMSCRYLAAMVLIVAAGGCEPDLPQPHDTPDPQVPTPALSSRAVARIFIEHAWRADADDAAIRRAVERMGEHVESVDSLEVEALERRQRELIDRHHQRREDGYEVSIADSRERADKAVAIVRFGPEGAGSPRFEPLYLRRIDNQWRLHRLLDDFDREEPTSDEQRRQLEQWRELEQWYQQRIRELV